MAQLSDPAEFGAQGGVVVVAGKGDEAEVFGAASDAEDFALFEHCGAEAVGAHFEWFIVAQVLNLDLFLC